MDKLPHIPNKTCRRVTHGNSLKYSPVMLRVPSMYCHNINAVPMKPLNDERYNQSAFGDPARVKAGSTDSRIRVIKSIFLARSVMATKYSKVTSFKCVLVLFGQLSLDSPNPRVRKV